VTRLPAHRRRPARALLRAGALVGALLAAVPALAEVAIPNHWDPRRRIERPNLAGLQQPVRVVTAHDHPPFNYLDARGEVVGFNVDLARAACAELGLRCTLQALDFDLLAPALREGRAEMVAAGLALTSDLRRDFEVGETYLRPPARFAARRDRPLPGVTPRELAGRTVAVVAGTRHAAFLDAQFATATIRRFETFDAARDALRAGEVDAVFGDAVALAFFVNGTASRACCVLVEGAFRDPRYLAEGYAFVFRPGAVPLAQAFDHALQRLHERGIYAEIYLRWFPVGLY
jgi:polar amino acid transport system substrate-binding protein